MGRDGIPTRTSGEYPDLLLAAIQELREDQREFRSHVGGKLDAQSTQISEILVTMAQGTGRMNILQQSIDTLSAHSEETDRRVRRIEAGSGVHPAVSAEEGPRPRGNWISIDKIPAILMAIATLISVIFSCYAVYKAPTQPPSLATTPPGISLPGAP